MPNSLVKLTGRTGDPVFVQALHVVRVFSNDAPKETIIRFAGDPPNVSFAVQESLADVVRKLNAAIDP